MEIGKVYFETIQAEEGSSIVLPTSKETTDYIYYYLPKGSQLISLGKQIALKVENQIFSPLFNWSQDKLYFVFGEKIIPLELASFEMGLRKEKERLEEKIKEIDLKIEEINSK